MEESKGKTRYSLLVIGGSAGALTVIIDILQALPVDFPIPVVIILHRLNIADDTLERLLFFKSKMPIKEVEEKDILLPGNVYIAPADYHLLIEQDHTLSLDVSEKVQHSRPSIDVTFECAATVYGTGTIAVLLSGASSDGSDGLKAIKKAGGTTIIQSPEDAEIPYMPYMGSEAIDPDHIVATKDLTTMILRVVNGTT